MADPEGGVPVPNPLPAPVPQAPQAPKFPQGQQLVHLNCSFLSQNFQENLKKMPKHICSVPTTG